MMIIVCREYYLPNELENFTLFQSAISFFGVLFVFRLDSLFYIEKTNLNREILLKFCLGLIVLFSVLFFVFNLFLNIYNFNFKINLLLIFGIILMGFYTVSQTYLINQDRISLAAISRLAMPILNLLITFILIKLNLKEIAMEMGLIGGMFLAIIIQLIVIKFSSKFKASEGLNLVKHYRKDLFYGNFIYFINSFRDTLFILFISMFYQSKEYVASYSQGLRIVSLPALVLSGAIGTVVGSYLKIEVDDRELLKRNYFKLLISIILISTVIYVLVFFFMDFAINLLFSKKWMYVSTCAKSLIPWLFVNFILNSLNGYFLILRFQLLNLVVNIFEVSFFILTFLLLGNTVKFEETLFYASLWSLLFGTILILILSIKIIKFAKK